VKETNLILGSSTMAVPISTPPWQQVTTAGLILFLTRISWITLIKATVVKLVDGAPFNTVRFPQIIEIAKFQPKTAIGKLKAVITPITPRGFQHSIMKCSGRSEGIT